jgi:hypothetical protein
MNPTELETAAATEADKLRAEMTTELTTLEAAFHTAIANLRADISSPHGHMVFGVMLFAAGFVAGHWL